MCVKLTSEVRCWFNFDQHRIWPSPLFSPPCAAPWFLTLIPFPFPQVSVVQHCDLAYFSSCFPLFPMPNQVHTVCGSAVEVLVDWVQSFVLSTCFPFSVIVMVFQALRLCYGEVREGQRTVLMLIVAGKPSISHTICKYWYAVYLLILYNFNRFIGHGSQGVPDVPKYRCCHRSWRGPDKRSEMWHPARYGNSG